MKKLLILVSILTILLTSCSSDSEDTSILLPTNNQVLIKKIVTNGNEFIYSCNGNKLNRITFFGDRIEYFYTGNLITKSKRYNSSNNLEFEVDYTYSNGKLVQEIINSFMYSTIEKFVYVHNADNTISFVKYQNDTGSFQEINHGNYNLNGQGEVMELETFSNSNDLINRFEFTFDSYNIPYKNIEGFSKLFSRVEDGLYSNVITRKVYDENNSLIQTTLNEYTYNQNNYPLTRSTYFDGSTTASAVSQFYY